jgi:hypothetical protein
MSHSNETIRYDGRYDDLFKAIEKPVIEIAEGKIRIRVLSVHPSERTGESQTEVTLRLAFRPDNGTQLEIVNKESWEARLSELGFTYSFRLNENIDTQVNALVRAIKEDAPRALKLSPGPRVVFIDPVSRGVKTFAAVVSVLVALAGAALWRPMTAGIRWEALAEAARTLIFILVAAAIYKLITTSFKLR